MSDIIQKGEFVGEATNHQQMRRFVGVHYGRGARDGTSDNLRYDDFTCKFLKEINIPADSFCAPVLGNPTGATPLWPSTLDRDDRGSEIPLVLAELSYCLYRGCLEYSWLLYKVWSGSDM